MRGAGKTTLSRVAADTLAAHLRDTAAQANGTPGHASVEWVDCDDELVRRYNEEVGREEGNRATVSDIVAKEGWPGFRERERALLFDLLVSKAQEHESGVVRVVSCGGGVVETEACRDLLKRHCDLGSSGCCSLRLVVEVRRDIRDIELYLDRGAAAPATAGDNRHAHRPAYAGNASLRETYARRLPWFKQCASHSFVLPYFGGHADSNLQADLGPGLLAWDSGVKPLFVDWFRRIVEPRVRLLTHGMRARESSAVESPYERWDLTPFELAPWSHFAAASSDGSRSSCLAEEVITALAKGARPETPSMPSTTALLPPPTSFPCITLNGIRGLGLWGLLPKEQLLDLASAVDGGFAADDESAAIVCLASAPLLHPVLQLRALPMLADALYSLTASAGTCSAVELRADTILKDEAAATAAGGVEEALAYTLFMYRYCWSLGFKRRAYGQGSKAVATAGDAEAFLARPAVDEMMASGYHFSAACPPLIFTVRTQSEGGALAFEGGPADYCGLVRAALKVGHIDCVDLEMGRAKGGSEQDDAAWRAQLQALYREATLLHGTTVIASCHWPGEAAVPSTERMLGATRRIFELIAGAASGNAAASEALTDEGAALLYQSLGAVKLIGSGPSGATDVSSLVEWVRSAARAEQAVREVYHERLRTCPPPPLIALCMGFEGGGHFTRVLNQHLTPVTHALLPSKAAPGQLTAAEILDFRRAAGLLPPFNASAGGAAALPSGSDGRGIFNLFGSPIKGSPSPLMHNSAFEASGLSESFAYGRFETEDPKEAAAYLLDRSCAGGPRLGGNVTIPLKQSLVPALEATPSVAVEASNEASAIGAVNTLMLQPQSNNPGLSIRASNTDWFGIALPLMLRLSRARARQGISAGDKKPKERVGLVVGAGGTAFAACYALLSLCPFFVDRVVVHNPRTLSKGEEVAEGIRRGVAKAHGGALASPVPVSASVDLEADFSRIEDVEVVAVVSTIPAAAAWTCPEWLVSSGSMVVFDVAYRPRLTPLLQQVAESSHAGRSVQAIEGAEMLIHQGAMAWGLWMGRTATGPHARLRLRSASPYHDTSFVGVPWAAMADAVYSVLQGKVSP